MLTNDERTQVSNRLSDLTDKIAAAQNVAYTEAHFLPSDGNDELDADVIVTLDAVEQILKTAWRLSAKARDLLKRTPKWNETGNLVDDEPSHDDVEAGPSEDDVPNEALLAAARRGGASTSGPWPNEQLIHMAEMMGKYPADFGATFGELPTLQDVFKTLLRLGPLTTAQYDYVKKIARVAE